MIKNRPQLFICLSVLALFFLIIYTLFINEAGFTYDEPYYLTNVALLHRYGLNKIFLLKLNGPAGPLYGVLHWLLEPLTGLKVRNTRVVNIIFFIGIIFLLMNIFKAQSKDLPIARSFSIVYIPMVFVCSGMALTEISAMFFLTLSIFIFIKSWKADQYILACLAGFCMSIAILGRQPYLLLVLASPLLLYKQLYKRKIVIIFLFIICSLAIPLYVFSIWQGLVPHSGGDVATREALAPFNLFISLGYAFWITLFLSPQWLILPKKKNSLFYFSVFLLILFLAYYFDFRLPVMASISKKIFPLSWQLSYAHFMAAILILIGFYFLYSTVIRAIYFFNVKDFVIVFYIVCCLLMLASSVKITHQFSSRYVFQAAPFFILMFGDRIKFNYQMLPLRLISVIIGIASLYSYFY